MIRDKNGVPLPLNLTCPACTFLVQDKHMARTCGVCGCWTHVDCCRMYKQLACPYTFRFPNARNTMICSACIDEAME
jgi:hypothetical protein